MGELEIFGILLIPLCICLYDWRLGVLICIAIGFLQDLLRKFVPDEPVYFTVLIAVFVAATIIGAYRNRVPFNFHAIHEWNRILKVPLSLFVGLVIIQSVVTVFNTNSLILAGIGLLAYLSPLPAILLGYHFCQSQESVTKFARFYLFFCFLMISGIYISYAGFEWVALKSVGEGLYAYSPDGERLTLFSGFLRSPEIAAWHACTAVCFALLLILISEKWGAIHSIIGILVIFFGLAIILTGRRKFILEIVIFISIYTVLTIWFQKSAMQTVLAILCTVISSYFIFTYAIPADFNYNIRGYYDRGATVQNDATGRASLMTVDSFEYVIAQNGFWGAGAGTGSQGAQHFGGGDVIVGGAAEGGLGKVLAELGVPGMVILGWLAICFIIYIGYILKYVKKENSSLAKMAFWLLSFQGANLSVYVIAHQVFGDIYVLVLLGFSVGFMFAIPKMVEAAKAQPAINKPAQHRNVAQKVQLVSQ